jgi:hypothetical protein
MPKINSKRAGIREIPIKTVLGFFMLAFFLEPVSAEKNIIFSQAQKIKAGISGEVLLPDKVRAKTYAFLLPLGKALSYSVRFLIAPSYQTEVQNSKFYFPFAEEGRYVLGVYEDTQANGLLDIGKERFSIAPGSPFTYSNEPISFQVSLRRESPLKLHLEDYPQEFPIYLQVFSTKKEQLYVLPLKPPEVALFNLPLPVRLGLAEDENQDLRLDISEIPETTYLVERPTDQTLTIQWEKGWNSLTLDFPRESSPYPRKLYSLQSKESTELSSDTRISFFDFPEGKYRIDYEVPDPPYVISSPVFKHEEETRMEFLFSPEYSIYFEHPSERSFLQISLKEGVTFTIPSTDVVTVYQVGEYEVVAFDENDENGELDEFKLSNDGVIFYTAELTDLYPRDTIRPEFGGNRRILRGQYHLYSKARRTGQIIFFQKTPREKIFNTLQVLPIRKAGRRQYLKFYFRLDPTVPFLSYIDFNEDFLISGEETAYLREFDASDPEFFEIKHSLYFPLVDLGSLEVLVEAEKPEAHFLEVFAPGKDEAVASIFLGKAPTYLYQLPLEVDLRLRITFDRNENEELDQNDTLYPEQSVVIPFETKTAIHKFKF